VRDLQQRIARDVRGAWADSVTAYQHIAVADQLLNPAKLSLALARGRYNLGLSSIVELSQAQLNEAQAEIDVVNARYDYEDQNAALQYQAGQAATLNMYVRADRPLPETRYSSWSLCASTGPTAL
jgi:outer membrane protein